MIHMDDVLSLPLLLLLHIHVLNKINMDQMKLNFLYCGNLMLFVKFIY